MSYDPKSLMAVSQCWCLSASQQTAAWIYLLAKWFEGVSPVTGPPVLSNGAGGYCRLVVSVAGEVGAEPAAGPATSPVPIIADGSGGFWQLVTDGACNRGTTPVAGPAAAPVVLTDSNMVAWTLIVDNAGNLGATS